MLDIGTFVHEFKWISKCKWTHPPHSQACLAPTLVGLATLLAHCSLSDGLLRGTINNQALSRLRQFSLCGLYLTSWIGLWVAIIWEECFYFDVLLNELLKLVSYLSLVAHHNQWLSKQSIYKIWYTTRVWSHTLNVRPFLVVPESPATASHCLFPFKLFVLLDICHSRFSFEGEASMTKMGDQKSLTTLASWLSLTSDFCGSYPKVLMMVSPSHHHHYFVVCTIRITSDLCALPAARSVTTLCYKMLWIQILTLTT